MRPLEPREQSETEQIVALARRTLTSFIGDPEQIATALVQARQDLPDDVMGALERLAPSVNSYRDALLVQLAIPLVRGQLADITRRAPGGRAATGKIGELLRALHIKGVKSAFENIGKNTPELVRGNSPDFDHVLGWGSANAALPELERAYRFVVAAVAETARSVSPRPRLRLAQLTFANVMSVLDTMLTQPSGGAHEQYICAAALTAFAALDAGDLRVATKPLNATDKSSSSAGDIELYRGGRLYEGIEVSRSLWREKLSQAEDALRAHGLGRAHIVARSDDEDLYGELRQATDRDISVVDPRAVVSVLVALLDRGGREHLLLHVYELLDEMVASPELVNQYVDRLRAAQLVDT